MHGAREGVEAAARGSEWEEAGEGKPICSGTMTDTGYSMMGLVDEARTEPEGLQGLGMRVDLSDMCCALTNGLALVTIYTGTKTALVQFSANWREAKLLVLDDRKAVRALKYEMSRSRSAHEVDKEDGRSMMLQCRAAAMPDETSGAGIKGA